VVPDQDPLVVRATGALRDRRVVDPDELEPEKWTIHDTDDPDQPEFEFGVGVGGSQVECLDVIVTMTASYKGQDGVARTTEVVTSGGVPWLSSKAPTPTRP
jgi:hypothetical protein